MPQKRACSRVISVRYGTGCYRHLRIPSSYTLEELAEAILEAFDFINDHAHAFFMDDRCWSEADAYWMDSGDDDWEWEEEEEERFTSEYTLDVLKPGQSFKFVFDFGESWSFQCKLLSEMEDCEDVELLRTKGKPPEQYAPPEDRDGGEDEN